MATTADSTHAKAAAKPRTSTAKATPPARTETTNASTRSPGFGQATILGAAAAGLLAGLAATIGRKVAVQAANALTGDWLDSLKTEHKAALKLFDKLEATSNSQTTKRNLLLMQLKHALAKHAFEEENIVYPALRDHAERAEADHLNHDHGYVKQYLYDLSHMSKNTSGWLDKVREFRAELTKHIREEEDDIFPTLHTSLGKTGNAELTTAMNREGFKLA